MKQRREAGVEPPPRFLFYLACNTPANKDVLPPPSWKRSLKWQVFVTIPRWTTCAQNPIRQRSSHVLAAASSQMLPKSCTSRLSSSCFPSFLTPRLSRRHSDRRLYSVETRVNMRIRIQTHLHGKMLHLQTTRRSELRNKPEHHNARSQTLPTLL